MAQAGIFGRCGMTLWVLCQTLDGLDETFDQHDHYDIFTAPTSFTAVPRGNAIPPSAAVTSACS